MATRRRTRFSVRLGTVAGIDIRVHASFLLLFGLVALASTTPEGPGVVAGLAWLVALFACVVFHELAHSLVAQHHGITVTEIDLLPIGGVSQMARLPDDPKVELRIAAAGPAASAALALVFALVALATGAALWPPDLYRGEILARLAWVNLMLAAFNLLPALPLDGGRVFRALLEQHSDRRRATEVAARVARVLALVMIGTGVLVNVWLVLIGAFVYLGSRAEEAAAEVHEKVKDLTVREVMLTSPPILRARTPVDAVPLGPTDWYPVIAENRAYIGLVDARTLRQAATRRPGRGPRRPRCSGPGSGRRPRAQRPAGGGPTGCRRPARRPCGGPGAGRGRPASGAPPPGAALAPPTATATASPLPLRFAPLTRPPIARLS